MSKVLLLGNGAREHAIAEALKREEGLRLYAIMSAKNPGIISLCDDYVVCDPCDVEKVKEYVLKLIPEFIVIGPEAPLAAGVVDVLEEEGFPCIGPRKQLAQLETSKSFTRDLLENYHIEGNPKFKVFISIDGVREFIEELREYVVKADGLKGGKGVKVSGEHLKSVEDGVEYCRMCIEESGKVVVEEKFIGEEFSLQFLTDGYNLIRTPTAQDHKRAYENDEGPNTGGMGSYSDSDHLLPFLTRKDIEDAELITRKVCNALRQEFGVPYRGIMYGGFIATKDGVKLIEYNARFGDPETMNVLPILKTNFSQVCRAMIAGNIGKLNIEFENKATVCKYAVPEGYPDNPIKGEEIDVSGVPNNVRRYYASVNDDNGRLILCGSRAIAFVGVGESINEAEQIAQMGVSSVKGRIFYRNDIGTNELIEKRINHMKELR